MAVAIAATTGSFVTVGWAGSSEAALAAVGPRTYVALGDSFTAGPDVPTQLTATTTPRAPAACDRSSDNYPSLVARAFGLQLTDVSCGGATTASMTTSEEAGIPPQLTAVKPDTALVTLGIGGNDIGFGTIAKDCIAYTPWGPTKVGWNCRDHYQSVGTSLPSAIRHAGTEVTSVVDNVRARAPRARILLIGYPDILPSDGSGCWPKLPFTPGDASYLRSVEDGLNAMLAGVAHASGVDFVDMATASAGHDACTSPATRWVEPVLATPGTEPLHPDAAGMAGMAAALEGALRSS